MLMEARNVQDREDKPAKSHSAYIRSLKGNSVRTKKEAEKYEDSETNIRERRCTDNETQNRAYIDSKSEGSGFTILPKCVVGRTSAMLPSSQVVPMRKNLHLRNLVAIWPDLGSAGLESGAPTAMTRAAWRNWKNTRRIAQAEMLNSFVNSIVLLTQVTFSFF